MTVYFISDYGKLHRTNETFEFVSSDGSVRKIFPHQADSFIISGLVSITGNAMRLLMQHQINTVFTTRNGKYNGKLCFTENKNVFTRKKQYTLSCDEKTALPIAKSIIWAKIKNELHFIQRINRKDDSNNDFIQVIDTLKDIIKNAEQAENIAELRGYEGIAARKYFSVFRHNIIPDWADFPSRSKNPPLSNVNAVLSFLYTLLMYRLETAIELAGLDPMLGFMHAMEYGKNTLVFDLMEEFRTPIADTLCCALFNHNVLTPEDFYEYDDESDENDTIKYNSIEDKEKNPQKKAIYLTQEGLNKVINGFEKKMTSRTVFFEPLEEELTLNQIVIEQAAHFKQVLLGRDGEYRGFLSK
jgi:CRISPR-associated protein Cas1